MSEDKDPDTYRMNEVTGEWEKIPKREPFIASWDALIMVALAFGTAFGGSILLRLFIWG